MFIWAGFLSGDIPSYDSGEILAALASTEVTDAAQPLQSVIHYKKIFPKQAIDSQYCDMLSCQKMIKLTRFIPAYK